MIAPVTNSFHVPACGGVYLLCSSLSIGTTGRGSAKHYLGDSINMRARFLRHKQSDGACITKAMRRSGGTLGVVRIWPGANKKFADRMKRGGLVGRLCPFCNPNDWYKRGAIAQPGETVDLLPFTVDYRERWPDAFYIEQQFARFFVRAPVPLALQSAQRNLFHLAKNAA